jgi:NitT/TauT family transport system permease protein
MSSGQYRWTVVLPLAVPVAVIAAWWGITNIGTVPSFVLPTPGAVVARLVDNPSIYATNARYTLERVLAGSAVGILLGVAIGLTIHLVPVFRRILMPYLVTVRVLPKIAVAPVLLIYFGTGPGTAIILIALIVVFPMILNTAAGLERTPQRHRDLLASVDAGGLNTLLYLRLPYALPDIFAGLKQSVTLAVVGAIVAEWIVVDDGLGYLVLIGSENLQTDLMLAALFVLLALGIGLYTLVAALQRWAF